MAAHSDPVVYSKINVKNSISKCLRLDIGKTSRHGTIRHCKSFLCNPCIFLNKSTYS